MKSSRMMFWAATAAAFVGPSLGSGVLADTVELTGTIRDFRVSHPDMETFPGSAMANIVEPVIGEDGNPQLNMQYYAGVAQTKGSGTSSDPKITVGFLRGTIHVSSTKPMTEVYVRLDNGRDISTDGLERQGTNRAAVYEVSPDYAGHDIVGAWVVTNAGDKWFDRRQASHKSLPVASAGSFHQWFTDVQGTNIPMEHTITLDNGRSTPGGIYRFAREKPNYFFPIDQKGYGLTPDREPYPLKWERGGVHNFHFTYELHTKFTYSDPEKRDYALVFSFTGDDDVWAYINGKLVVDLGGVHQQESDSINLDEAAESLGLKVGHTYPLDFFFAERHTSESNFKIETTLQLSNLDPLYD